MLPWRDLSAAVVSAAAEQALPNCGARAGGRRRAAPAEAVNQEKLRESFDEMTGPVRLLFFTQTLGCETCLQTRQILDELPPLSDRITIEEVNFVLDKEKATQYGIDRVPASRCSAETTRTAATRLAYPLSRRAVRLRVRVARPGGAAGRRPALEALRRNRDALAAVDDADEMQVFTTPT